MAEDGVPGGPPHQTRVIRDRLGQVVREPPGPPPGYEERVRRQAEAAREIYDSGSEEEEGAEAIRATGAPLGPPPPNPAYLQEVQSISMQLSTRWRRPLLSQMGRSSRLSPHTGGISEGCMWRSAECYPTTPSTHMWYIWLMIGRRDLQPSIPRQAHQGQDRPASARPDGAQLVDWHRSCTAVAPGNRRGHRGP